MNRTLMVMLLGVALGAGCSSTTPADPASGEGADESSLTSSSTRGDAASSAEGGDGSPAGGARDEAGLSDEASAAPCPAPERVPEGMACVEGGTFTIGFGGGQPDEREPGEVFVDTFYMDAHEVTNVAFRSCVEKGPCNRPMPYREFGGDRQPIVAVSWGDAAAYCKMVGKRLPTEAEWERAASGPEHTQYPWGNEPAGCERANVTDKRGHGCGNDVTLPVGSKGAGHHGLFDMAGNVHEWVADWYSPCIRGCEGECGDACFGRNPRGPCDGAADCPGRSKRSIRGGSWYWPEERARTTARRGAFPENTQNHRFGFRCARDMTSKSSSAPSAEEPSSAAKGLTNAAGALGSIDSPLPSKAKQLLSKLPAEELAFPDEHYYHSNEWRHDLLEPSLRGLGGAFVGVGADQNFTMAALAGSELILVVDFDPRIPRLHQIYEVLVPASATPDELLARFDEGSAEATSEMLREALAGDPNAEAIVTQFQRHRSRWRIYLGRVRRLTRGGAQGPEPFGWLADHRMYSTVRNMFTNGRVIARAGDVTGETTLRSMGRTLSELGVPVNVLYLSNAEQFFPFSESFVNNIRSLPTTQRSVVVRTTRHSRLPNARGDRWHYIVHDFDDYRTRLESGEYPRDNALLADLLSAGPRFIGRDGLSHFTKAVPTH